MSSRKHSIDWPCTMLDACRLLESAGTAPSLAELARKLGVSSSELQRQFTRRLGISPKAYVQALQLQRLVRDDNDGNTLDTVYAAGFQSVATAYESAVRHLGAPPGHLRKGVDIGWWLGMSDLGWMLMGATAKGICWLAFGAKPGVLLEDLRSAFSNSRLHNDEARLRNWFDRVRDFVLLPREALDLPLDIQGTAFQAGVWKTLRRIPLGQTRAYGEIAEELGQPQAARAVAAACASNKIALLIPCHRVVGAGGRLAGYRWGVERKARLLERERSCA